MHTDRERGSERATVPEIPYEPPLINFTYDVQFLCVWLLLLLLRFYSHLNKFDCTNALFHFQLIRTQRAYVCGLWMCVSATVAAAATTAAIAFVSKNSENVHNPAIAWMNERTNEWCKKTTSNSSNYSKLKRNRCAWHSMTAFQFESSAHRMCVSVYQKIYHMKS